MKKIITLLLTFLVANLIFIRIFISIFDDVFFKWYLIIPLGLISLFFSFWIASAFIMVKFVRYIVYIAFFIFIYYYYPVFIKIEYIIPFVALILFYENKARRSLMQSEGLIISSLKIIDARETLPKSYLTIFRVTFDLATFVSFGFDCITQGEKLDKSDLINILKKTNRDSLIKNIELSNNTEERTFKLNYPYKETSIDVLFEVKGRRQYIERDLKKL